MPENKPVVLRNFFISGQVDGTKNPSLKGCGPRAKDGGFKLDIKMRHRGEVSGDGVRVVGKAEKDGTLKLSFYFDIDGKREVVRICKQR